VLNRAALLQRGVTLIELMITLAIIAIALVLAVPAYSEWIQNTQIRSATESMLVGIKLARAEALKRNAPVRFELMDSTDSGCAPSNADANWVVSVDPAEGKCDVTDPSVSPFITQVKAKGAGMANATISATVTSIVFDALGRIAADFSINITNSAGGACVKDGGKMRCLRILVTAGGQARMCDPAVTDATDPRSC
jgi:type IV fimbrial biogenesis protein FimT